MLITGFGSCRLGFIKHNKLNSVISMTYSTKEVIQLIKFLKGDISIPFPYNKLCFRQGLKENREIILQEKYKNLFEKSDLFVIEICSRKKYVHNGFYLFHESVDPDYLSKNKVKVPENILKKYKLEIQTDKEILEDIKNIKKELSPKKLIIVSHYNANFNGKKLESRNHLINLLEKICRKNDITFIDPTQVLRDFKQEKILKDLFHYTVFARIKLRDYFKKFIKNYN